MSAERQDEVQYLIDLFEQNWQPVEGYEPGVNLVIHSGEPDNTSRDPQIVVDDVIEIPRGASGYDAFSGDGEGFVRRADGTADIRCISGTDDDVDVKARYLAGEFAKEVTRILTNRWAGVTDPNTGDIEYRNLGAGVYTGPSSDQEKPGRWFAVQEARYVHSDA